MALKKTIATKEGGYNVEMHPLEEAETLAHWAIHNENMKCPPKPSQADEHEWLIQFGAEYVKQKRDEWQKLYDANQPNVEIANNKFQDAHKSWCDHANLCVANGHNPDTYPDARNLSFPGEINVDK